MAVSFKTIARSKIYGDETSKAIFKPLESFTVQELCDYILSKRNEWGRISIGHDDNMSVEYFDGKYVDDDRKPIKFQFPLYIRNSIVKIIKWHGGWFNSDWIITI